MNDHIVGVKDNPIALVCAGNAQNFDPVFLQVSAQIVGKRADVGVGPTTGDYHEVTNVRATTQVERDHLFCLQIIQGR